MEVAIIVFISLMLFEELFETIYKKMEKYKRNNEQYYRLINVPNGL